jgi:homoserine acetyltransferase
LKPETRREYFQKRVEYPGFRGVNSDVKTEMMIRRVFRVSAVLVAIGASVGCMTTYDSAGRPVQSVDPAVAVAGAAAAGLVGYAIANDNNHHHGHGYYGGGGYYAPRPYYGGYHRGGRYYHR